MNTRLDEMKRDFQEWEIELNELIVKRNNIMSSPNLRHIDLTKINEIIKKRETKINEAKEIIAAIEYMNDDSPPAYEEFIKQ